MDFIKGALDKKLNNDSQPGDQVEGSADNFANTGVNDALNDAGVPQQDDGMVDKFVDSEINKDIPLGNDSKITDAANDFQN